MPTEISQIRKAVNVNNLNKYEIHTLVTDKGDFDDDGLFLVEIKDVSDPKDDVLIRIVTLADLDEFNTDRDEAIDAEEIYWRSPEFIRRYDSLDVAIAASRVIQDRVSQLTTDWAKYTLEFEDTGAVPIVLPLVDDTLKAETVNNYIALNDALTASQTALETAAEDLVDAEALHVSAVEKATVLKTAVDTLAEVNTSVVALKAAITGLENLVARLGIEPTEFGTLPAGGSGFYALLDVLLVSITTNCAVIDAGLLLDPDDTMQAANDALQLAQQTFIAALPSNLTDTVDAVSGATLTAALAAKNITVDSADVSAAYALALAESQLAESDIIVKKRAALTAAANTEVAKTAVDAALVEVLDICPDFDVSDPEASLET